MADQDGDPPPDAGPDGSGIPRSEHARLCSRQGRPIAQVVNDIQKAGSADVFIQTDDGRFVVRGPRGREHVLEPDGEHVTSVRRPDASHRLHVQRGAIRPATTDEFQRLKGMVP